jgi:hypothetical protein
MSKLTREGITFVFVIVLLTFISTLAITSPQIMGYSVSEISQDYSHSIQITADSTQEVITQTVVFDTYKSEACGDGIAVYTSEGVEVSFTTQNEQYNEELLCIQADVVFDNIIYSATEQTEQPTEEPAPAPETPIEEEQLEEPEYNLPKPEEEPTPDTSEPEEIPEEQLDEVVEEEIYTEEPIEEPVVEESIPEEIIVEEEQTVESEGEIVEEEPTFEVNGGESQSDSGEDNGGTGPLTGAVSALPADAPKHETYTILYNLLPIEELPNEIIEPEVKIRTTQLEAEIFKPVEWEIIISPEAPVEEITVNIPIEADNIKVDNMEPPSFDITVDNLTAEDTQSAPEFLITEETDSKTLIVTENLTTEDKIVIKYDTLAPTTTEETTEFGKRVIVSSDLHYENILTYTTLETPVGEESISLFWIQDGVRVDVTNNVEIELIKIDNNNDGLIDYLEWVTPHTSDQIFEIDIDIQVLNPYTFLRDGENWTVVFNTTGTADLLISSPNANWTEIQTDLTQTEDEMTFLNIFCGETDFSDKLQLIDIQNNTYEYISLEENDSVKPYAFIVQNYSCNETAYFSNYMHKAGYATLRFDFAGHNETVTDFAYDPYEMECILSSDYTQTGHNDSCSTLVTNGNKWDTAGYDLTVSGDVNITGTGGYLDAAAGGTVTVGSMLITSGETYNATSATTILTSETTGGFTLNCDGTLNHNNGLIQVTNPSSHTLDLDCSGTQLYDLHINANANVQLDPAIVSGTINNDLTLSMGSVTKLASGSYALTVTGDVLLEDTATLGDGSDTATWTLGSLTIESGTTVEATSGTIILTSETAGGYTYNNDGTFTHNSGTVSFRNPSDTLIDATGTFNNVDTGNSALELIQDTAMTIAGNLTINNGDINTSNNNYALTVGENVIINSGDAIIGKASAISFGTLTINNGGTYSATSGITTLTNRDASLEIIDINSGATFTHNSGTVKFGAVIGSFAFVNGANFITFWDVVQDGTTKPSINDALDIDGDLTVTSGEFEMQSTSDVAGDVLVQSGGTLDLEDGGDAHSFKSLTINSGGTVEATAGTLTLDGETAGGFTLDCDGTFTGNSGLVQITNPSTHTLDTACSGTQLYDLYINANTNSVFDPAPSTIDNDLTLSMGSVARMASGSYALTVTGDVLLEDTATLGDGSDTATWTFGSLTIESGTTFKATSGITRITSETAGGFAYNCDGTYTHASGTFDLSSSTNTQIDADCTGNLYDVDMTDQEVLSTTAITIDNDLVINMDATEDFFSQNTNSHAITITGDTTITRGTIGAGDESGDWSFNSLTIASNGAVNATSGTTTIDGNLLDSGAYTYNGGITDFAGASASVDTTADLNNTIISGNVTFNSDVNYSILNITATGNLTFNANNNDNGTYYYKATDGFASITSSSVLTSTYSYFADSELVSNASSTANFIDEIEAGSSWSVSGWDSVAPIITLNAPSNYTNISSQNITFNFTIDENDVGTVNCSLYIDTVYQNENATTENDTLTNVNATDIAEGPHSWNVTCIDVGTNYNTSETRNFTVDASNPNVTAVSYSPTSLDSLDPSTSVLFNATVSDDILSIDTVILQYHNGTDWENVTMTNNTATNFNATITTVAENTTYTYNIFANDTVGNINQTINQTFISAWDCTWNATTTLGSIAGWSQNKFLGNISINNTGDIAYSNNNCSLDMRVTYDISEGRIYYKFNDTSWESVKNLEYSTLSAGDNAILEINGTFLSEVADEDVVITLDEFRGRSDTAESNVSVNLITNQEGPYLLQEITALSDGSTLFLTDQNITLTGRTRNIMGIIPANDTNTAYNTTINWTIPSGFTVSSGSESVALENMSNSSWNTNELVLTLTDLATMTPASSTFTLTSQGFNQSGNIILDVNNQDSINDSITVTFLCYNTSDGTCVTSCGYLLDSDCTQATTSTSTSSGSGGGSGSSGGGGGGGSGSTTTTFAEYELVRNSEQSFVMYYNNSKNLTITKLTIDIKGFNAKYIRVSPATITNIRQNQKVPITTYIQSPTYFNRGEHNLTYIFNIERESENSKLITREIRYVTLRIIDISEEDAQKYLDNSKSAIDDMIKEKFVTTDVNLLFKQANIHFDKKEYLEVKQIGTEIIDTRNVAFEVDEFIKNAESQITGASYWGIKTPKTSQLLDLAKAAFNRGEYVLAKSRIEESQLLIALETKGEVNYMYYTYRNWKQISIGSILIIFTSLFFILQLKKFIINEKLGRLSEEESTLLGLMKQVQKECFVHKTLGMNEYLAAMNHYEQRLSSDIQEIISLRSAKSNLFRFGHMKPLSEELEKLSELLKQTQKQYLSSGKIQTSVYQQKMKSITKRITSVEEQLTVAEAESAIKKQINPMFKFFTYLKIKKIIRIREKKKDRIGKPAKEIVLDKPKTQEQKYDIHHKTTHHSKSRGFFAKFHISKPKKHIKKKHIKNVKNHKMKFKLPSLKFRLKSRIPRPRRKVKHHRITKRRRLKRKK